MHDILRVQDLIRELEQLPMDSPVMIAVVKYPDQFEVLLNEEGEASWDTSQAVEVCPLESGEVYIQGGEVVICVELTDYEEEAENHLPGQSQHS